MEMSFSAQDEAFRAEVKAFLAAKLPKDVASKVHNGFHITRPEIMAWHEALHEQGWITPNWPEKWGGPGWTTNQKYIFDEESSLAGAPRPILFGVTMCGPVLMRFGTEDQQNHFLPKISSGEIIFCQGYSEPGSGSDLASL